MRQDSPWAIKNNYKIGAMFRSAKPCADRDIERFRKRPIDVSDHTTWGFYGCLDVESRKIITIALDRAYDPAHQIGLINLATTWVNSIDDSKRRSGDW